MIKTKSQSQRRALILKNMMTNPSLFLKDVAQHNNSAERPITTMYK